jgi:hypothetical protein
MSLGRVGMLTPSGKFIFRRGVIKAAIPAIIKIVPRYFMAANPVA